ncbi:sigma-54-dependent Fis family transcriptional regulator [Tuberibacillus sp. Marseille-P3662]|uniref:sigma-54-dependent Fis family transcriptional regulator n=1 Tax=Tuberibacillus sp. Marseille-P3662 TaxID=1965358 RepID=UPI000A1C842A|nr:sigma-54-dependent Fis family transcriptional regulator [Tuberibacillus sp. Marseille-P3662]
MNILGIAPYPGMMEIMRSMAKEDPTIHIDVYFKNLQDGLHLVKETDIQQYDVIVSRGGTAALIREHVEIPVIDVKVSGYDLLRVLTLVDGYNGKAAILGFSNVTQGASAICDILNIDIDIFTVRHENEVEPKIKDIKDQDVHLVIGDVITVETAQRFGMQEILLTSGEESIREAFTEAKEITHSFRTLQNQTTVYKEALNNSHRGVVILNQHWHVIYQNQPAKQWHIHEHLMDNTQLHMIFKNNDDPTTIDNIPIQVNQALFNLSGKVFNHNDDSYYILYIDSLINKDCKHQGMSIKELSQNPDNAFLRINGSSEAITKTTQLARQLGNMPIPIWIYGEAGTGKSLFAEAIQTSRSYHHLIVVNITEMPSDKRTYILFGDEQNPGMLTGIQVSGLCIKGLESLSNSEADDFNRYLLQQQDLLNKIIVVSSESPADISNISPAHATLVSSLSKGMVEIPPLRHRKEDIEDLVKLFIAEYNTRYGKQVVGVAPDLLAELKAHDWQNNIQQLRQTVEKFIIHTTGAYIQPTEVLHILQELKTKPNQGHHQNVSGTLQEIEQQIIKQVLEEENMNQSKAAERLGINRTTLWRKLK